MIASDSINLFPRECWAPKTLHLDLIFFLAKLAFGQGTDHATATEKLHSIQKWISRTVESCKNRVKWFWKFPASEIGLSVMLLLSKSCLLQGCKMRLWVIAQAASCLCHLLHILEAAWLHFLPTQVTLSPFSGLRWGWRLDSHSYYPLMI